MPRTANKPKAFTEPQSVATVAVSAPLIVTPPDSMFGCTFTFRFRQHNKTSNFSGLWEFAMLDENGKVTKLISDADALNFCIDNLMGELESEGF